MESLKVALSKQTEFPTAKCYGELFAFYLLRLPKKRIHIPVYSSFVTNRVTTINCFLLREKQITKNVKDYVLSLKAMKQSALISHFAAKKFSALKYKISLLLRFVYQAYSLTLL